mmetsp:Transcript_6343/g.18229  ORF Transcript_6343/g.18229 Transcript_6343/m.18229 type:complete len:166 (-) Transcript_6343:255-752(-)
MSIRHIKLPGITIVPLVPKEILNFSELKQYENYLLQKGYEGVVVRSPHGIYKNGRSTLSEGYMIKIKQYVDSEAIAVAVEELLHDNCGNKSSNSGKAGGNTLGAIVARKADGTLFKIGTGYTKEERRLIWLHKDNLVGRYIKYKCAKTRNTPAVFLGIRHHDDVS